MNSPYIDKIRNFIGVEFEYVLQVFEEIPFE